MKYEGDDVSVSVTERSKRIISGNPDPKFVKVDEKVNTEVVNLYRDTTGKLPNGITEEVTRYVNFKLN